MAKSPAAGEMCGRLAYGGMANRRHRAWRRGWRRISGVEKTKAKWRLDILEKRSGAAMAACGAARLTALKRRSGSGGRRRR
jgi:hypothetical protein